MFNLKKIALFVVELFTIYTQYVSIHNWTDNAASKNYFLHMDIQSGIQKHVPGQVSLCNTVTYTTIGHVTCDLTRVHLNSLMLSGEER